MNQKRLLVGCEYSGKVREAFRLKGWDAWSCDIIESSQPGQHIQADIDVAIAQGPWDMMIAFPPCTHLSRSGAMYWPEKRADGRQQEGIDFFMKMIHAIEAIGKGAVENPIGYMNSHWRKPDQIIQPWQFGHGETKATCLWLHNLPKLVPENIVEGRVQRLHNLPPGTNRAKLRSETYSGIANAMANQWSN